MKRITIDFRHKAVIRDGVGNRMSLGYGREGIEQDLVPCIGSYVQIEIYLRIEGERATFLENRGKLEKGCVINGRFGDEANILDEIERRSPVKVEISMG